MDYRKVTQTHGPIHDHVMYMGPSLGTHDPMLHKHQNIQEHALGACYIEQRYFSFIMDAPSIPLMTLFTNIDDELPLTHPLHLSFYDVNVMETGALAYDLRRPYSYFLIRTWSCNCIAEGHKQQTVHAFQLDSPLLIGCPDGRVYWGLCQLRKDAQGEPPHAKRYRGKFTSKALEDCYREGSTSEFVDITGYALPWLDGLPALMPINSLTA